MPKESNGGAAEVALGRLGVELVMAQRLKHHPHVREVLRACLGEDEDVIAVHLHKTPEHWRAWARAKAGHDPAGGVEG